MWPSLARLDVLLSYRSSKKARSTHPVFQSDTLVSILNQTAQCRTAQGITLDKLLTRTVRHEVRHPPKIHHVSTNFKASRKASREILGVDCKGNEAPVLWKAQWSECTEPCEPFTIEYVLNALPRIDPRLGVLSPDALDAIEDLKKEEGTEHDKELLEWLKTGPETIRLPDEFEFTDAWVEYGRWVAHILRIRPSIHQVMHMGEALPRQWVRNPNAEALTTGLWFCRDEVVWLSVNSLYSLSRALKVNASLTSIVLINNTIGADGARAIGEALKLNASLTFLGFGGNTIGGEGATALASALRGNASLTKLVLSDYRSFFTSRLFLQVTGHQERTRPTMDLSGLSLLLEGHAVCANCDVDHNISEVLSFADSTE